MFYKFLKLIMTGIVTLSLIGCSATKQNAQLPVKIIKNEDAFLCQYKGELYSNISDNFTLQAGNIAQGKIDIANQAKASGSNAITINQIIETGANRVSVSASRYICTPEILAKGCNTPNCNNLEIIHAYDLQRTNYETIPYKNSYGYKITKVELGNPKPIYKDKSIRHWDIDYKPAIVYTLETKLQKILGKKRPPAVFNNPYGVIKFTHYDIDIDYANNSNFEMIVEDMDGNEIYSQRGRDDIPDPITEGYSTHWWNTLYGQPNKAFDDNKFKVFIFNHRNNVQAEWIIEKEKDNKYCLLINNQKLCGYSKQECAPTAKNNFARCEIDINKE